jgi:hypothetical protein
MFGRVKYKQLESGLFIYEGFFTSLYGVPISASPAYRATLVEYNQAKKEQHGQMMNERRARLPGSG